MSIETEIKYKVNKLPVELPKPYHFNQIYFDGLKVLDILKSIFPKLNLDSISTFRVRRIEYDGIKYIVTLKTKSIGYSRGEFEKEVDETIYNKLIFNNILSEIIKNRYVINKNGFTFEFDEYLNLNIDLITCEVELDNFNAEIINKIEKTFKNDFELEYFNVTNDNRYKNSNLIKYFGR